MKAAWRERYGGPHVVEVRDIEKPTPSGDQVLVRVEAASVNRADLDAIVARWAFLRLLSGLRRPRVKRVGLDVAGVVLAVGQEATRLNTLDLCQYRRIVVSTTALEKIIARASAAHGGN